MADKVTIASKQTDYPQWYLDVAKHGDLFEYSPVPGCITFLPKAVTIWEKIKYHMDQKLKAMGVQNLYLPMLIPLSYFQKEQEHVEGFAPELAIVTIGGGKELEDKLAIRPTSETMFCDFFQGRLQSYRDLPLLYNQRVSVLRWEKRTRPFLRTSEFYWQEGHTLHLTRAEAEQFALSILHNVYIETIRELLAISGLAGTKSESEKFAGAVHTYTYESMMSNGWALQSCTSHLLSQGFMKSFDVGFINAEGQKDYPWYTSWGMSTRTIGGMISSHSDEKGLIIPPRVSEFLAVILPIYHKDNESTVNEGVLSLAKQLIGEGNLVPYKGDQMKIFVSISNPDKKVLIDYRNVRLGEKLFDFELSGYPLNIQVGARDLDQGTVVVGNRITGTKESVSLSHLGEYIENQATIGQNYLRQQSYDRLVENTVACDSYQKVCEIVEQNKFALYDWDISAEPDLEERLKNDCKGTTRCIPFEGQFTDSLLPNAKNKIIIARNF